VPDDVALIGFEDSPIARHTNPPLTGLRQPTEDMGRTLARILLEEIAAHPTAVVLATGLVRWESAQSGARTCSARRCRTPGVASRPEVRFMLCG
jgi:DNA-binding LacI/PurR family transcriptional regulator